MNPRFDGLEMRRVLREGRRGKKKKGKINFDLLSILPFKLLDYNMQVPFPGENMPRNVLIEQKNMFWI